MALPTESTPFRVAKQCLSLMSDETFLSTIDYVDFSNRYVSVKPGYWKTIVLYFKQYYNINEPKLFLRSVKVLFLERLHQVSANKLKSFFLGRVFCSFINFKNIMNYVFDCYDDIDFSKAENLRKVRHYEKLAKQYYLSLHEVMYDSELPDNSLAHEVIIAEQEYLEDNSKQLQQYINLNSSSTFDYYTEDEPSFTVFHQEATYGVPDIGQSLSTESFLSQVRTRVDFDRFHDVWISCDPEDQAFIIAEFEASNDKTRYLISLYDDSDPLPPSVRAICPIKGYERRIDPDKVELDRRLEEHFIVYGPPIEEIDVNAPMAEYVHIDVTSEYAIPDA